MANKASWQQAYTLLKDAATRDIEITSEMYGDVIRGAAFGDAPSVAMNGTSDTLLCNAVLTAFFLLSVVERSLLAAPRSRPAMQCNTRSRSSLL